jgi:ribosomal protein S6--L-glutamate ligase
MRLAFFPKNPQDRDLFLPEFQRANIDCEIFRPSDVWITSNRKYRAGAGPQLTISDLHSDKNPDTPFSDFDLIFQRSVPSWNNTYGPDTLQLFFDVLALAQSTTHVVNPPLATLRARRKHVALSILSQHDIPTVPFYISPSPVRNMNLTTTISVPPAVLKPPEGAGGIGVVLARDHETLGDLYSLFHLNRQTPLTQPYYPTPSDLRVFVISNKVIATIKRTGTIYKHNISLGATPEFIPPAETPKSVSAIATKATKLLNLPIAGVDILKSPSQYLILEVNPSPAFSGLSRASGINVPRRIAHYIKHCSST